MNYDPIHRRASLGLAIHGPFAANRRRPIRPPALRHFLSGFRVGLILSLPVCGLTLFLYAIFR